MTRTPTVTLNELRVVAPDGRVVLDIPTLKLHAGEIVWIDAPSGAGKSTLLRLLAAPELLRERGFDIMGRVEINGPVGMVGQRGALFDFADVGENLRMALAYRTEPLGLDALRRQVDLDDVPDHRRDGLSGGQQQRIAMARVFALRPHVVLLDEPGAGLDAGRLDSLVAAIQSLARQGCTVALVTHQRSLVEAVGGVRRFELSPPPSSASLIPPSSPSWLARTLEVVAAVCFAFAGWLRYPWWMRRLVTRTLWRKALWVRPALFFLAVSILLGVTMTMVFTRMGGDLLQPDATLKLLRMRHIKILAPPLGGILFAATSASAVSAWLGALDRTGQVEGLHTMGLRRETYLWTPAFWTLTVSALVAIALFAAGLTCGTWLYLTLAGVTPDPWALATQGLYPILSVDRPTLARALLSAALYAPIIASQATTAGRGPHPDAASVTRDMVRAVIFSTLAITLLEAVTAAFML